MVPMRDKKSGGALHEPTHPRPLRGGERSYPSDICRDSARPRVVGSVCGGIPPTARRLPVGFAPTSQPHWSDVLTAADTRSPQARAALEKLCRAYWYPLYRHGAFSRAGTQDAGSETGAPLQDFSVDGSVKIRPARGSFKELSNPTPILQPSLRDLCAMRHVSRR